VFVIVFREPLPTNGVKSGALAAEAAVNVVDIVFLFFPPPRESWVLSITESSARLVVVVEVVEGFVGPLVVGPSGGGRDPSDAPGTKHGASVFQSH